MLKKGSMRKSLVFCSCIFFFIAVAQKEKTPPYVEFTGTMNSVYKQGDIATVDISVQLIDPENVITEAVLFLNVVEIDEAKKYPQAAHLIFADASSPNDITKKVYTGDELRVGLATTVTFVIKDNAKPANYSLALQLFNGTNTDPNRVKVEERIDMKNFKFTIEPK
jgi:hypothetical protein